MVGFYKHDIPAWMDGTEALSDGAYRAYHVIVQLIMLNEGPIALNERGIAGRCNQAIKTFRVHLDALLKAGKLTLSDGRLSNPRAEVELQAVMKNRENAGKGGSSGKKPAQNSAEHGVSGTSPQGEPSIDPDKSLENNDAGEATLDKLSSLKEKRREDTPIVPKGTDPPGFPEFWAAYPKRDGDNPRKTAVRAYAKAIRRGVKPETLMTAVRAYAEELAAKGRIGTEFVAQASTWLNQERFDRFNGKPDPAEAKPSGPDTYLANLSDDDWRGHVRRWRSTGGQWPLARRTEPPDDPRTKVPGAILAEFDLSHSARANLTLLTGTGR